MIILEHSLSLQTVFYLADINIFKHALKFLSVQIYPSIGLVKGIVYGIIHTHIL